MNDFKRRRNFYRDCQRMIDEIHDQVSEGKFISDDRCRTKYGQAQYNALLHELRRMNADTNFCVMTPAMEWLYYTQYFSHKAKEEKKQVILQVTAVAASIAAVVTSVFALVSSR